ncbi:hypothetical protein NMG60_11027937 [Bertholletia excelsa]
MATDGVGNADRINKFFSELEARKALLNTITQLHKTLTDHFSSLEQSLSQKSQALDSQIEAFDAHAKETLESLQNRENAIPECESAAAARVEEQRETAITDIEKAGTGEGGGEGEVGGEEQKGLRELLRMYCRRMDTKRLMRFLLTKRKESVALRAELAAAVEEAVDLARLVLEAVEDFVELKAGGKVGMADRRWACGLLIQVAVVERDCGIGGVARSLRERAACLLEKWKGLLGSGGAGEATMFLQMVVGFGLKENFEEEYLKKLVVEFSTRRDMARIAVALGFKDKMKDIIDELVTRGKEIEAVYFIYEAGLTTEFPPVPLLRTYLKNCRKNANNISKNGHFGAAAVEEANNSELNATKAIIKCVEDHKLESQFNLDTLKKRVVQLEKAKSEKKIRTPTSTSKPTNKRPHGGGGRSGGPSSFRPPKQGRFSSTSSSFRPRNLSQPHQVPAGRFSTPYNYASPGMYDGPTSASSYGPGGGYGGSHTQSPAALPPQYPPYPPEIGGTMPRVSGSYGGQGSYAGQAANYTGYDYSSAAGGPAYPPYPQ